MGALVFNSENNGKANDVGMVYNEQTESFVCLQALVNKITYMVKQLNYVYTNN